MDPLAVSRYPGTRDLYGQEMVRFRRIEEAFRRCCLRAGYEEVRTPTLEYLHLFTAAGTLSPDQLHRVYSFLDWDGWSGERVALRPDGTIPAARLYADAFAGKRDVVKMFYVENMFAFPREGQERERWQCGAELLGGEPRWGEIELLLLAADVLGELGLTLEVRLAHAGLWRELNSHGGAGDASEGAAWQRLAREVEGSGTGYLANLRALAAAVSPAAVGPLDELSVLADALERAAYPYRVQLGLASWFEYYTGPVFQLVANGAEVGRGGRYDALVPLIGGPTVPAAGFALYVDRLLPLVPSDGPPPTRVLLRVDDRGALRQAHALARRLREAGWTVELDVGYTQVDRFRWIVVCRGGSALDVGDQRTGQSYQVGDEELVSWLREHQE